MNTEMIKSVSILGFVLVFVSVFLVQDIVLGQGNSGGRYASDCNVSTVSAVTIGDDLSTSVLSSYSNRAWARIGVADGETEPIFLSFDEGADATVDNGIILTATSSTYIDFGLNTDLPYTDEVTAITGTASTTVSVTECRY